MTEIMSFLISNYVWILVIVIVTLLAIIGSYANKTNFGEGTKEETEDESQKDVIIENKKLSEVLGQDSATLPGTDEKDLNTEIKNESSASVINNNNISNTSSLSSDVNIKEEVELKTENKENLFKSIEEKLSSLDNELNTMLPKKEVIDDNILEDLEDISLDNSENNKKKIKTIKTSDIELPKIKSLKDKEEDVWKKKSND